jgi:hypothetical protein
MKSSKKTIEEVVASSIRNFILGGKAKKSFVTKSFPAFTKAMRDCLVNSPKWNTQVVTKEQAIRSKGKLLEGDLQALLTVPLKVSDGLSKIEVSANMLNVHLRDANIKTKHSSSLSFTSR